MNGFEFRVWPKSGRQGQSFIETGCRVFFHNSMDRTKIVCGWNYCHCQKKEEIDFIFFFSEHLTHRTICLSALSNARKNKEMRIKIILYRMKYAIRFYHFNDRTPLALWQYSCVKMNVAGKTDTVGSSNRVLYDLNTNFRNLFPKLLISATMAM